MLLYSLALVFGTVLLMWSADKFVDGASSVATRFGMSRLLVGMVIVGFGTSAPEMLVSALAALDAKPGLALGNLYGSNIANISLVLGVTILIRPVTIDRNIAVREIPILLAVTLLSVALLWDLSLSRLDAFTLFFVFFVAMFISLSSNIREKKRYNELKKTVEKHGDFLLFSAEEYDIKDGIKEVEPMKNAVIWLILGILLLVASSQLLVWSAVGIATMFGVSDIIIGLTIVAIGTSLPELAAAIAATRKKEHGLVIGNILGSNFFNSLMGVGIVAAIQPVAVESAIVFRDLAVVTGLTFLLFVFCLKASAQKNGVLSRYAGFLFLFIYLLYTGYLANIVMGKPLFCFEKPSLTFSNPL